MKTIVKSLLLTFFFAFSMFATSSLSAQAVRMVKKDIKKVQVEKSEVHTVDHNNKVVRNADGTVPGQSIVGCKPGCEKACCVAKGKSEDVSIEMRNADGTSNAVRTVNYEKVKKACAPGCEKACCVAKKQGNSVSSEMRNADGTVNQKVKVENANIKRIEGPKKVETTPKF